MLCKIGNGPTLFFLHGFLGSKEDWDHTISYLKDSFTCYAIDLPGHGDAPLSNDWFKEIIQYLDKNVLKKPNIIGYSMGGRLAMQIVQKYPHRFNKKIFFSSHPGLFENEEKLKRKIEEDKWIENLRTMKTTDFIDLWYKQDLFSFLTTHPGFSELAERRKNQNQEGLIQALDTMRLSRQIRYEDFSNSLFVYGEKDLKYAKICTTLPVLANILSIPSSGHAVHIESPKDCANIIEQYIGRT